MVCALPADDRRRIARMRSAATLAALALGFVSSMGCGPDVVGKSSSAEGADTSAKDGITVTPTGCADAPTPHIAPNGYYVNGNTICTEDGRPHLFHGLNKPSLEWDPNGQNMAAVDFEHIASWNANVVRIPLNQDFWLDDNRKQVDDVVRFAEEAGMDVLLDLHWSDKGERGGTAAQQQMADEVSIDFWKDVAKHFKDDGRVMFDLYNEPHDVAWSVWLGGGDVHSWTAVGMQALYDAVRGTGAENLIVVGGLNYAYDLSRIDEYPIDGYNLVYATHLYDNAGIRMPENWDKYWGAATKSHAVVVGEFGQNGDKKTTCPGDYNQKVIEYADDHYASWIAWAWFPGGCTFPGMIASWDGTPSTQGTVVRDALGGYDDPAPGGKRSADP